MLMADHGTAGGYPVVAAVVSASMPVAAQLVPGDELRFEEITVEGALQLRKARGESLASLRH
jgi:antagonist of KipI